MVDLDDLFLSGRRYGQPHRTLREVMQMEETIEEQFPHVATITPIYRNPGEEQKDQLRLLGWLHTHDQENHRDYVVETVMVGRELKKEYRFKDPKVAMMFKLTFI